MKEYYINKEGKKLGPFSFEEMKEQKIYSFTKIWREGLDDWEKAINIPEIKPFLKKPSGPPPIQQRENPSKKAESTVLSDIATTVIKNIEGGELFLNEKEEEQGESEELKEEKPSIIDKFYS